MKDIPNTPAVVERQLRKARNKTRYERRYGRHKPATQRSRFAPHAPTMMAMTDVERAQMVFRGVPQYLQTVVRMMYGAPGQWGHGRQAHGTKSGPGRRPLPSPLLERDHPVGTKLVRRFIRGSGKESTFWRGAYAELTGKQYG